MPVYDQLINALLRVAQEYEVNVSRVKAVAKVIKDLNTYELKTYVSSVPDVVAGDSSRVLRTYSLVVIYAFQAVAVKESLRRISGSKLLVKADAGYYIPSLSTSETISDELLRRVIQFVSRDLELDVTINMLDDVDVALFDGSIFSFLWYSKLPEVPTEFRFTTRRPRKLRELWRDIVNDIVKVRSKVIPIFIAKSIRRSYYVDKLLTNEALAEVSSINDLLILNLLRVQGRLPKNPFVLEPVYLTSIEELPRPLNTLDPEDRRYIEPLIPITVTYVSFSESLQPYQVTIPGKLSANELIDLFSSIYPYSSSGYPDPLKIAHNMCKLSTEEIKYLLLKLGFSSIPTGREPLGELI